MSTIFRRNQRSARFTSSLFRAHLFIDKGNVNLIASAEDDSICFNSRVILESDRIRIDSGYVALNADGSCANTM